MVELLIASFILVILMGAAMTFINPSTQLKKARDTKRKQHLNQYRIALETYSAANNSTYPIHETAVRADSLPAEDDLCDDLTGRSPQVDFIESCPGDPLNTSPYQYSYQSDESGYEMALYARLEIGNYWAVCGNGQTGEVGDLVAVLVYCSLSG